MCRWFFVSDLHGLSSRYNKLIDRIRKEIPAAVFMGGDMLPSGMYKRFEKKPFQGDFIREFLQTVFSDLRRKLGREYPRIFMIMGNNDPRILEPGLEEGEKQGLWEYLQGRQAVFAEHEVFGYSFVNPTPFLLKDWEKHDVSRDLPKESIAPEAGIFTAERRGEGTQTTIAEDLESLAAGKNLSQAIFLFHAPPYGTNLDQAPGAERGRRARAVGSLAIRGFIERHQPLLTLHGHIHESAILSGSWRDQIGSTTMFSAAHAGAELALVRIDLKDVPAAKRELI